MDKIKITRQCTTDGYWLKYIGSNGELRQISLAGCANNFKLTAGGNYPTDDGMQIVGWRYKSNGCLCYELFCVGHVQLYYPLEPGLPDKILYLLKGQEPIGSHLLKIDTFEHALNQGGWKTVPRPDDY